jgi:hypothetical protein
MILFELPSGKSIYISVERFLTLSKQDIQDLVASNIGYSSNDPFIKLPTTSSEFHTLSSDDEEEIDDSYPDLLSDGDDDPYKDIDINNITDI